MKKNIKYYVLSILENGTSRIQLVDHEKNDWIRSVSENPLLYSNVLDIDFEKEYDFCFFSLPFSIRKELIAFCNKNFSVEILFQIFNIYCKTVERINNLLSLKYDDVHVFGCIYENDLCIISPCHKHNLSLIQEEIINFLFKVTRSSVYEEMYLIDILRQNDRTTLEQIISSDRQFIRYNPNYKHYMFALNDIDKIKSDSYDRKQELSLFSTLVLKDLIEETHMYWLYDSGDLRFEKVEISHILDIRFSSFSRFLDVFCSQADDENQKNDWIWSLMFLTQTTLASIMGRTKDIFNDKREKDEHKNFYGFLPVITTKEQNREVSSFFHNHISRQFCYGFLVMPYDCIYKMPDYLPAYIHEFFHYIPPKNRIRRNKTVLKLILHSIFSELRNSLSNMIYDIFFHEFYITIIDRMGSIDFESDEFFDCDSMEYMERIREFIQSFDFNKLYYEVLWNLYIKNRYLNILSLSYYQSICSDSFKKNVLDYMNIFVLFFREIRSDIAMCLLLNLNLENYIKIMSKESFFALMSSHKCGDSTIMRFGFMCRYLAFKENSVDIDLWDSYCKEKIDDVFNSMSEEDKKKDVCKFQNLKSYLEEYKKIAIEPELEKYVPKGSSLLEDLLRVDVAEWEKDILPFSSHNFIKVIRDIYTNYSISNETSKIQLSCGMRLLFRDLYAYNPDLDL